MLYGASASGYGGGAVAGYSSSGYGSSSFASVSLQYSNSIGYAQEHNTYSSNKTTFSKPYNTPKHHDAFIAKKFLAPNRPNTPIISRIGEVKEVMEEAYEKLTGQQFPHADIKVVILPFDEFHNYHAKLTGSSSKAVMGFSYNQYGKGISEIFVKEEHIDSLLLTLGHEIGHVLSPSLPCAQDEEAKAHAFSIAWMETIRDKNIAGLQPNILLNPAKNGLHDKAYEFVMHLMQTGASAHDVFETLKGGLTSILASID